MVVLVKGSKQSFSPESLQVWREKGGEYINLENDPTPETISYPVEKERMCLVLGAERQAAKIIQVKEQSL